VVLAWREPYPSGGIAAAKTAPTSVAAALLPGPGPGLASGGGGAGGGAAGGGGGGTTGLTSRARTAILRVTDALSRRSPLTSTARTETVAGVALTGARKRILNLPCVIPDRFSTTQVPALRRCRTTRVWRGARLTVPLAVTLAPAAADAGTDSEIVGDAAACAARGQLAAITISAASATDLTRIFDLRSVPLAGL
jgi:type IV secretion system protein VirB6/type IV secretion system protein TrbL